MITKESLFNKKDAENYCKLTVTANSHSLPDLYEALDSQLEREISEEIFIVDYRTVSSGVYELTLDVDDVDFSEFED